MGLFNKTQPGQLEEGNLVELHQFEAFERMSDRQLIIAMLLRMDAGQGQAMENPLWRAAAERCGYDHYA